MSAQFPPLAAEIDQLRARIKEASAHLYAAKVQRSPSDDKIIADHVENAYEILNAALVTPFNKVGEPS